MPTPLATAAIRYGDNATTVVYWVPSIAATNLTPTRAELNAGTNIGVDLVDSDGWMVEAEQIDSQALNDAFQTKIPGSLSAPDSSLTFALSKNGVDIRTLNPRGASGNVCFLDGGDIAGNKMETYPVTVTSNAVMRSLQSKDIAKVKVGYAITKSPGQNLTVPA
jgi:hypothetical protein